MKPARKSVARRYLRFFLYGLATLVVPSAIACLAVFWLGRGGFWSYAMDQTVQSGSLLGACSAVAFAYGENRKIASARVKGFALVVIGVLLVGGTGRTADEVISSQYSIPSSPDFDQFILMCAGCVSLVLAAMALGALGAAGFERSDSRA